MTIFIQSRTHLERTSCVTCSAFSNRLILLSCQDTLFFSEENTYLVSLRIILTMCQREFYIDRCFEDETSILTDSGFALSSFYALFLVFVLWIIYIRHFFCSQSVMLFYQIIGYQVSVV